MFATLDIRSFTKSMFGVTSSSTFPSHATPCKVVVRECGPWHSWSCHTSMHRVSWSWGSREAERDNRSVRRRKSGIEVIYPLIFPSAHKFCITKHHHPPPSPYLLHTLFHCLHPRSIRASRYYIPIPVKPPLISTPTHAS